MIFKLKKIETCWKGWKRVFGGRGEKRGMGEGLKMKGASTEEGGNGCIVKEGHHQKYNCFLPHPTTDQLTAQPLLIFS